MHNLETRASPQVSGPKTKVDHTATGTVHTDH
jgi:hypothetical protein